METIRICSLIKIGQQQYMKDLLDNGTIYMNHISEFVKIEDGNVRGDSYESLDESIEIFDLVISHEGREIGRADNGSLQTWHEQPSGNIYSMYMLETIDDVNALSIDSKCKSFGDTAVIILKVDKFFERIKNAIEDQGMKMYYGPVEYIEVEKFRGKWSLFKKPSSYKYQREFRFAVKSQMSGPLILKLGSLHDIAITIESEKLEILKFSRE